MDKACCCGEFATRIRDAGSAILQRTKQSWALQSSSYQEWLFQYRMARMSLINAKHMRLSASLSALQQHLHRRIVARSDMVSLTVVARVGGL